ncbi:hypothetical protein D8M34_17595 [Microbacterium sp. HSID17254]|uniref:hypothetical protein n=1 Tax=Microbacterium sp. HSID17254 TaxID=2419509 RepID=UPI000F877573|nr:hypothetical protein [Microbacterium sp. HSID17254]RUQ02852.1 hypothetical protein D8M34_17595 [Microbacterium sp. HSID17254]
MSWCAYVDESEPDPRFGPGAYVLAAALIDQVDQEAARVTMAALRLRGQRKLHWHDEDAPRRQLLTDTNAGLPALHLIVVTVDVPARSERRRRLCLARLLPELDRHGVREVYTEARETKQNGRDLQILAAMRARREVGSGLRVYHQPGRQDPLLWVPDVVAGGVGAQRAGEPAYLERFASLTTFYDA